MPIPKPAILQGRQQMLDLEEFYQDRTWAGLDLYRPPQDLPQGFFTQADNLYNTGGELIIRPGKQAQLTTAMGAPVYVPGTFLDNSGVTWILFVSGGRLYKIQNGGNSPTEIELNTGTLGSPVLSHLTLNGPGVQMARSGQYVYFIDGSANGPLYRTDLTYAYTNISLTEPTYTPAVIGVASNSSLPGFWASPNIYDPPPSYGTGYQAAVAKATLGTGGSIASVSMIHGGIYPTGAMVSAMVVDPLGKNALLEVNMNAAGTAVASVTVMSGHAGSGYTNPVVVFSVPAGTGINAFPNSCFPIPQNITLSTPITNWTGYTPNAGPVVTTIWSAHAMSVFGSRNGAGTEGSMSSLVHPAPIGANGTANYDKDPNGASIAWASFGTPGTNLQLANSIGNIQHGDSSGDWATQFVLGFYYFQPNANSAIAVTVTASTALGVVTAKTLNFHPTAQTSSTVTSYPAGSMLFDFSELQTPTDHIVKWDVTFAGTPLTGAALNTFEGLCIAYITGGPTWGYLQVNSGSYTSGSYQTQRYQQGAVADGWIADSQVDDQLGTAVFNNLTKDARFTVAFGTGASCTVTLTGTSVQTGPYTPSAGGSGYQPGTSVAFIGGGTGATGTVTLGTGANAGKVTGVTVTSGGTGYTSAPTLVFGLNFTTVEFVSVPLTGFSTNGTLQFIAPSDAIEMRLLPAGTTSNPSSYQTVAMTIDPSGNFATADVTSLPATEIACVTNAQIVFIDNPVPSASPFSFNIGALTFAGNLSVGFANYTYLYTEVDSNGDPNLVLIIQSDPSNVSNPFTPTGAAASAQITLPSTPLNGLSDRFYLYRAGGTAPNDGLYTLVASARWANTFAMGAQTSADKVLGTQVATSNPYVNPYVSWGDPAGNTPQAGTLFFVDNTPDAKLTNNPTLIVGRQPAPRGAQAIARFQNRLWLSVAGNVISSWILNASSDAGVYFNPTVDPTDPNAPIKGSGLIPVGSNDNDPVVGLKTLGTVLTVWKGLSSYFIDGYDPTNFGCNEYQAVEGQGLVAPKAIVAADNIVYLLQQDGLYTFDGSQLLKISDAIGHYLTPVLNEDGGQIAASAYANCACVFHGARLYLFAPVVGGSQNSVAHVWDSRFSAWVGRWTGMNITSGVSIGSNTDDPDIWLGGYDGQLYRFTGNGDTTVAGGTVSPVTFTLATRAYGRPPEGLMIWLQSRYNLPLGIEGLAWEPFFRKGRLTRLWAEVNSASGSPLSLTASAQYTDQPAAISYPITVTGHQRVSVRGKPDRGGLGVILSLTGATASGLSIVGMGATISRGARMD